MQKKKDRGFPSSDDIRRLEAMHALLEIDASIAKALEEAVPDECLIEGLRYIRVQFDLELKALGGPGSGSGA